MTLSVQIVRDAAALEALVPEWDRLDAETGLRTPFSTSLWTRLWLRHIAADRWSLRDEIRVIVIRDEAGTLIAIAPLMCSTRPANGPFRMRMKQFVGADPNMTELRRVICRPEDEGRAVSAVLGTFADSTRRWDRLELTGLTAPDSINWGSLPSVVGDSVPMYYLRLPESWEAFRASRSRNIKESLRKCYNSLSRDGLTPVFRSVESPEEVAAAIDQFLTLHRARAAADLGVSHRDVFSAQPRRAFLHEFAATMAREGRTHVFQLLIEGRVVATRIGFSFGRTLYLYYSGFDPEFAKYSVMTTTVAESIKWAIERQFEIVNLSLGNDVSKTRWGPEAVHFHTRIVQSPGSRSRMATRIYDDVVRLRSGESAMARLLGRGGRD